MSKSGIHFSSNVDAANKESIMFALGIRSSFANDAYLGMPLMFGCNQRTIFKKLKDCLHLKVEGSCNQFLSQSGIILLIQAVAQAISAYVMQCFKLPKTLLHEMEMIIAKFRWGSTSSRWKIHWKNWLFLCCSKLDGGAGFKDLESFNLALLARQWWRLIQKPSSLVFQVLRARYFPHTSLMRARHGNGESFLWASLLEGKKVVEMGGRWKVVDGCSIDVWRDSWIRKLPNYKPIPPDATPTPLKAGFANLMLGMLSWFVHSEGQFWEMALSFWKSQDQLELGFMFYWCSWNNRNLCFHKLFWRTSSDLVLTMHRLQDEYKEANNVSHSQVWNRVMVWEAPPVDTDKLNVDATFCAFRGVIVLGVMAQNFRGEVLFSAAERRWHIIDSLHVEFLTIHQRLRLAIVFAYRDIQIESDCLLAVTKICKKRDSFSEWYGLVQDILELEHVFFSCNFAC
ncbi:hypothetical protein PTKIN_Ptkin14bG0192800 [Pterospermum kingtungense]